MSIFKKPFQPRVSPLGSFTLIRDFQDSPHEVFDGVEPQHLSFDAASLGVSGFRAVDLAGDCFTRPERALTPELRDDLLSITPARVRAFNKSVSQDESYSAYFVVSPALSSSERLWVCYSFFEVSPGRFHSYIHALVQQNQSRNA